MDARKRRNTNTRANENALPVNEVKGKLTKIRRSTVCFVFLVIVVVVSVIIIMVEHGGKNKKIMNSSSKVALGLRNAKKDGPLSAVSNTSATKDFATTTSALRFVTVVDSGSEVNPDGRKDRLDSIADTWGPTARVIFVVSNITEFPKAPVISSNDLNPQYPQLLPLPSGTKDRSVAALEYTIRTILKTVDPDFALFTNCHTFVIPEHVCQFLEEKSPSEHLYAGHALRVGNKAFHPASSGYILSRTTMQGLVQKWDDKTLACRTERSHPGFFISECLKKEFQVLPEDTSRHDGQQFHSFPLMRLVDGNVDDWYKQLSQVKFVGGIDCCSSSTISFHYIEAEECRALFRTRQFLVNNPQINSEDLKNFMTKSWPSSVGGYSRPVPERQDTELWKSVLAVMRKIAKGKGTC